ncbi:hypothetical protein BUALT_Bualt07G0024600 [Buddleja alternifolia]|uniref:NB-ARC domain-containing protein n=1 Tax=Buddleja alternifolia TaxID=168488 RepID=A0AAV6XI44_9LAMI|nr:hypothetical protein BUALT_Bualt07G0024600 [Buddleja alternifolia]
MAIAAYASLLSLTHVLDQIRHPSMHRISLNTNHIQTLREKVHFLQEFLELHSQGLSDEIEGLAKQIAEVANEAELILDSHGVYQLPDERKEKIYVDVSEILDEYDEYETFMLYEGLLQPSPEGSMGAYVIDKLNGGSESTNDMGLSLLFSEDTIDDDHLVDQLLGASESTTDVAISSFGQDIDKVIEKVDSIEKELLTMVLDERLVPKQQPRVSVPAGPSALSSGGKNTMVGFDDHLVRIMDELTNHQPNLHIIPITGMGGIGKTTLARNVFENKCVVEHFDVCAWLTISQEYSAEEILRGILRDIGDTDDLKHEELARDSDDLRNEELATDTDDLKHEELAKLREKLHKFLFGKSYLIVMDDMWSTKAWDDLKLSFPDYETGSRIIVTTRLLEMAVSLGSRSPYLINFLDEDKSWDLFCQNAFTQNNCSPELEEPGKEIVKSCRGLPLAIVVIGGFLSKSNMTREYWDFVAENVNLYANSENDEQCLKILALSYQHLPIHLKPCFLYMRVFPEDHDIRVSKLINVWIAEGFVKPLRAKHLEEIAEDYLKDLIARNLIFIRKQGRTGKVKMCGMHDLLRDLCRRESQKEHFFGIPKVQHFDLGRRQIDMCFMCVDGYTQEITHLCPVILGSQSSSFTCNWVCDGCRIMYPEFTRLRFMNTLTEEISDSMRIAKVLASTTLQYLTLTGEFPLSCFISLSSLPLLRNLQTLIIPSLIRVPLPAEIWEMPQLRHIIIKSVVLPDPIDNQIETKDCTILENLHTLSNVRKFRLTKEVLERIPNTKKLKITYRINYSGERFLYNLAHLSKLESLFLSAHKISSSEINAFPISLKKLSLSHCALPWEYMTIIGSLPNLEVLKLSDDAFEGPEWNPVEGEFLRLKLLSINAIRVVSWGAEDVHFPCLEILVLEQILDLEEIPSGVGEIGTLHSIDLICCSDTVVDSAKRIIEEQVSFGNEGLQLYVTDKNGRSRSETSDFEVDNYEDSAEDNQEE